LARPVSDRCARPARQPFRLQLGEKYLTPDERKAKSASYLQDEIVQRIAKGPVVFDLDGLLCGMSPSLLK
jgi:hypothetical protein